MGRGVLAHFSENSGRVFESDFTAIKFVQSVSIVDPSCLSFQSEGLEFTGKQLGSFWSLGGD